MYKIAILCLASKLPEILTLLDDGEPTFTKRLATGIGLAEDPGSSKHSFGTMRSELLADCILAARVGNSIPIDCFRKRFAAEVHKRGLQMDALFLNPGSKDVYDASQFWFSKAVNA
jgi:hypothetical protein